LAVWRAGQSVVLSVALTVDEKVGMKVEWWVERMDVLTVGTWVEALAEMMVERMVVWLVASLVAGKVVN
jgi:hypothetical protein